MPGDNMTAQWYAVRTRSRHEKVVRDYLAARGAEPFLPLWSRWSRWKDRRKQIATPLFPGYCFAWFEPGQKLQVLKTPGVVEIVGTNGAIEPIPSVEIEAIRTLVNGPLRYDPWPFLAEGMEVEVLRGPLMGVRGWLLRKDRMARLVISITLIRQAASVEIDAADIAPV